MKECKTLDEAVAVMQRFEAVMAADPDRRRKIAVKKLTENAEPGGAASTTSPQTQGLTELCEKMTGLLSRQMEFLAGLRKEQDRPRFTGRPPARNLQDVECFHCRGKGHYSRECPQKTGQSTVGQGGNAIPLAGR
jgi:hypothetical protein